MLVNAVALNAALATGYGTGDVNGPTLVWGDVGPLGSTWTAATEPASQEAVAGGGTAYFLLLALTSGGGGMAAGWTKDTGEVLGTWHKETV